MTCQHCRQQINPRVSRWQAHLGKRLVEACSLTCLAHLLIGDTTP